MQVIELGSRLAGNEMVAGAAHHVFGQTICHRNFGFGRFAERHTQRVADAIAQQGTYARCALDATVFAFTGLGYAKMQGVVHTFALHGSAQQTHALHHHNGVAGFDRDHHILEVLFLTNAEKFHATLHDTLGCVAVTAHDAVRERTVVHADAKRRSMLTTDGEQAQKTLFQTAKLGGIFLIGVLQMLELAGRVHIVAGIDAHFFDNAAGSHIGHVRIEMHIGHQRMVISGFAERGLDVAKVLGLDGALRGETHIVATGIHDALALLHARLGVVGRSRGHTLNAQGSIAAQRTVADLHLMRHTGMVIENVHVASVFLRCAAIDFPQCLQKILQCL